MIVVLRLLGATKVTFTWNECWDTQLHIKCDLVKQTNRANLFLVYIIQVGLGSGPIKHLKHDVLSFTKNVSSLPPSTTT